MTTHDDAAIWAAQLADMKLEVICAFVKEQGYEVRRAPALCRWCAMALDALPVGDPPLADDEDGVPLPFDARKDTRS